MPARASRRCTTASCRPCKTETVSAIQHSSVAVEPETAERLLRKMLLIRRFEERTEEQYTRARIGGYCHLAIGEEAANVGAIEPLGAATTLLASYRDHGTALAVGSEPQRSWPSCSARQTGVAGGYGGSMHLLDVERHFFGGWGIVGGHLPIAVGAALALDYASKPNAVLVQLGEGATNIGAFHESLNLAAIWHLPIVFQVINNRYGMGTSVESASAEPEQWKRAAAYRMHGERVDGNDLLAVIEASDRLLRQRPRGARAGAARDDDLPLPRALGGRRGQGLSHADEVAEARARSDRPLRRASSRSTPTTVARIRGRSTPRSTARSARRPPTRPRRRTALRSRLRRPELARAVRARWRAAGRSASGRERAHGGRDLPRGAAARARRGARPRRSVFLMGEEIGRFEGSYKVTAGL